MGEERECEFRFFWPAPLSIFWKGSWPCSWTFSEIRTRGNLCPMVNYGIWLPISGNSLSKPHSSMSHEEKEGGKEHGVERAWAGAGVIVKSGGAWMRDIWCGAKWQNGGGGWVRGRQGTAWETWNTQKPKQELSHLKKQVRTFHFSEYLLCTWTTLVNKTDKYPCPTHIPTT